MKKTSSFLSVNRELLCSLLLIIGVLLFSAGSANAQSPTGPVNPYTSVAEKLNVTAYQMGTFDRTHSIEVLQEMLQALRPQMQGNNQSQYTKFKKAYLSGILFDVSQHSIAVEISLLTQLRDAFTNTAYSGFQLSEDQMRALYNEVVQQLQ